MCKDQKVLVQRLETGLQQLEVEHLARKTGFRKRTPKKIRPLDFLKAWCLLASHIPYKSLNTCASLLGLLSGTTVSKQGLAKRISPAAVAFVRTALEQITTQTAQLKRQLPGKTWSPFARVLLHDSTAIPLPAHLAGYFPGPRNKTQKPIATLKIQTIYNLLTESFIQFFLTSFRYNDQRASRTILPLVHKGDLIIRDLGYFALWVFRELSHRGVFFLSRFKYGHHIFLPGASSPFHLLKALRKYGTLDISVELGVKERLPVRLIAIRLPEPLAAERRRKLKRNRDKRLTPSKSHLEILGWEIFITNVSSKVWDTETVPAIYGLRWRIEIIFKSWKSHFRISAVPHGSAEQVELFIYARLIFITLFHTILFIPLFLFAKGQRGKYLSLLKLATFAEQYLGAFLLATYIIKASESIVSNFLYHCCYETRKRLNYAQVMEGLS